MSLLYCIDVLILLLMTRKDKQASLLAEMRQQDDSLPVRQTLHLAGAFYANRTKTCNINTPQSLGLRSIKKQICFLICTPCVVLKQNTNASKAFFHRGVTAVHHITKVIL